MRNALAKLGRVAQMSSNEVWVRACERGRIEFDRMRYFAGWLPSYKAELELLADKFGGIKAYLLGPPSQRFYASATPAQRASTVEIVRRSFPQWLRSTTLSADDLAKHQVDLFGGCKI